MIHKVGRKGKYVEIPIGWDVVTTGLIQKGDMYCNVETYVWEHCDADDFNTPVAWIDLCIRVNPKYKESLA